MSSDHKLQDPAVISKQDGVFTYIDLYRGNVGHHKCPTFFLEQKTTSTPLFILSAQCWQLYV